MIRMKKGIVLALLMIICSFTGCSDDGTEVDVQPGSAQQLQQTPTAQPTPTHEPSPTPTPLPAWMEGAIQSIGISGQYMLDDIVLANGGEQYMLALGDRLLLLEPGAGEGQIGADSYVYMQLIDIDNETIANTRTMPIEGAYTIRYGSLDNDGFYMLDDRGIYYVYDDKLEELHRIYNEDFEYDFGAISSDGSTVYFFDRYGKLCRVGADGVRTEIACQLPGISGPCVVQTINEEHILLSYYIEAEESYEHRTMIVNLQSGEAVWDKEGTYTMVLSKDEDRCVLKTTHPRWRLESYNSLTGESLGTMEIDSIDEIDNLFVDWERGLCITVQCFRGKANTMLWECTAFDIESGEQAGCTVFSGITTNYAPTSCLIEEKEVFCLLSSKNNEGANIYIWDYSNMTDSDCDEQYTKYGAVSEPLRTRIGELEEKYGIYIYAGAEVLVSEFDFACDANTSEADIEAALDVLDETLALYPKGFLDQLKCGSVKTLGIYLVGNISRKNEYSIPNAIAFAVDNGYERALVLSIDYKYGMRENIIHEISHWIDSRIETMQYFGVCEDFDSEYEALNPEDFGYLYSYVDDNYNYDYIFSYDKLYNGELENIYYLDNYAQTFPGEDRARCFEFLMKADGGEYFKSPHLRAKLECYFAAIREAFDTTGWPERTVWEELLAGQSTQ